MAKEIEAKMLKIDVDAMRRLLTQSGAKKISPLTKQRRYVFDIDKNDKSRWIRLRTDGKTTTLTVKIIKSSKVDGTYEYEAEVSDLDSTLKILEVMGFTSKSYQENYRELYELDNAMVSIDFWPKLRPYLEIEAGAKKTVDSVLQKLNVDNLEITSENTKEIYSRDGVDLDKIKTLIFSGTEEEAIKAKGLAV